MRLPGQAPKPLNDGDDQRTDDFRVFHEVWEANKGVDQEQLLRDIEQAVTEVREEKRRKHEQ